ncbi:DUF4157 domain-containing protein [Nostoc sp.]|uniref:eCIS core domain-containing protein n=1 Tax=Nostoc sp. TaxID=1180 RepID=UPI0035940AD3
MSDRTFQRHNAGKSNYTNPSLVSSNIPTLANPTRGFSSTNNTPLQTVTETTDELIGTQSTDEQFLEPEAIKEKPLGHDISRISLRSPQAKFTINEPENFDGQETSGIAHQVMQRMSEPVDTQPTEDEELAEDQDQLSEDQNQLPEDEDQLQMKSLGKSFSLQREELPEEEDQLLEDQDQLSEDQNQLPEDEDQLQMKSLGASFQAFTEVQPSNKGLGHDISRISLHRPQTKLTVNEPGDVYEQEADQVAQQVMRRISEPVNNQPIQRQELPEGEEDQLQMKSLGSLAIPSVPLGLGHDISRISLHRPQTKLTVNEPGDIYEQEADRVAQQVMRKISEPVNNQPIQREELPEDEKDQLQMKFLGDAITPLVQRKSKADGVAATPNLESSIQQARGGGQPLSDDIRQPMEQAFGTDFGGVKIHTDSRSHQLNQSIQARAFTTGQDIFFRQGEYAPQSQGGKELLAHELTHVVQQSGGAVQAKSIPNRTGKKDKLQAKSLLTSSAESQGIIQPQENFQQQTNQDNHKQEQLDLETDAEKEQDQQQESANENEVASLLPAHKTIAAANGDANPSTTHNQNFQYPAQKKQQVATEVYTANKELRLQSLPESDEQPLQAKELGDRTVDDSANKELHLQLLQEQDEQSLQAKELSDHTTDDSANKELRLQSLPEPDEQPLQAKELGDRTVDDSANKESQLQHLLEPDKQPLQAKELGDRTVEDSLNKELRPQPLLEQDEQSLQAKELPTLSTELSLNKELQKQPFKTANPIIQAKLLKGGITPSPISIQRGVRNWLSKGWNKTKNVVGAGVEGVRNFASGAVDKGKDFLKRGLDWVKNNVIQPLMRLGSSGWSAVKNFGSRIATAYKQANPTIWDVFLPQHLAFRMARNQRRQLFAQAIQAEQNQRAKAAAGIQSSDPAPVQEPSQLERLNDLAEKVESVPAAGFNVGKELLEGAVVGDFNENPTIWNTIGQVAIGFVPYAGQAADIRDIIANVKKLHEGGYKDPDAWINLTLTAIGIIPGVGDAIKAVGKGSKGAIRKALSGVLKNADKVLGPALGKAKGMLKGARRYGKQFLGWASRQGGRLRQGVRQFAQKTVNFAKAAGKRARGLVTALRSRISGFVTGAMQKARAVVSQGRGLMGRALSQFMGMAQNAFNALQNRVSQAANFVKAAAQRTKDIVLKVTRKVADTTRKATTLLREFTQSAIQKGRQAAQKARQWSSQQVKRATDLGRRLVKKARDRVTSLIRQGVKLAKDKALAWIQKKIGGIKQRLLGFLKDRWNRLKDKLGIGKRGKPGQEGAERGEKETTDHAARKAAARKFVDNIVSNPTSLVGKSANDIAKQFKEAGFEAIVEQSIKKGTSGKAVQIRIKGHPEITNIQVHPGGGRHTPEGVSYWKISTNTQGKVWVVPRSFKGIESLGGKYIFYD